MASLTPQSNQRGIETTSTGFRWGDFISWPQSNQRGIETLVDELGVLLVGSCLNRTSVGLKPRIPDPLAPQCSWPQSNQRGIETHPDPQRHQPGDRRLNRTSVGLKQEIALWADEVSSRPQSNQRGIETFPRIATSFQFRNASIEPAWD